MKSKSQLPIAAIAAALIATVLPARAVAGDPADLVASPEARRGDVAALAARWFASVREDPDSREAQAILFLWGRHIPAGAAPAPASSAWRDVLAKMNANGWSSRQVLWNLHRQLLAEGDLDAAAAIDLEAGSPRKWLGIGPFGRAMNTALHTTYPPELEFDPEAAYEGTDSEVRWRDVYLPESETRLDPASEWARQGAIYYLRARFALAADADAIVQVSGEGSFQVFIDGERAALADRGRDAVPVVLRAGVRLSAGKHSVLVKTARSPVAVLFRDTRGFPLPIENLPPAENASGGERGTCRLLPEAALSGLVTAELQAEWRAGRLDPAWRLPLAELLILEGNDSAGRELFLEEEANPRDPIALAMVAIANSQSLDYLPGDWKKNWLDELASRALEADEALVPVRLHKAEQLAEDGNEAEAFRMIDEVIEVQERSLAAWLARAALAQKQGWEREWIDSLRRLEEHFPGSPEVLGRLTQYHASHCHLPARALPYRERRFAEAPSLDGGTALAAAYAQAGKIDAALALWPRLARISGESTGYLREKLEFFAELGRIEEALQIASSLAGRVPDDAWLHGFLGNMLLEEGRFAEAATEIRASLALNPGQVALLRTLRFIEARERGSRFEEDDYWAAYEIDGEAAIAAAPPRDRYPKAAGVYIVDHAVTRFPTEGGAEEMVHQIVRLDSKQAVDNFSEISVPGEVIAIRIITPDGTELHPTAGENDGTYTLPGLEPGCIIEYRSIDRRNLAKPKHAFAGPFYFRDAQNDYAFHRSEMVLLHPASWTPQIRERAMPFSAKEREVGDYRELTWRADEMDRMEPENLAPPPDEIVPNIAMLPEVEWEEVLDEVASRWVRSDFVTPELAAAAKEILAGVPGDRRSQVEALYAAVCDRVKSAGPSRNATSVWLMRSGSRDLLLGGLLRAAGIRFDCIVAAEKDALQPYRDWSRPTASFFELGMLRVVLEDGTPFYVTAAYRMAPPGRIPSAYQGARAILVRTDGGEWTSLPASPYEDEALALKSIVDAAPRDGNVKISADLEWKQLSASNRKDQVIALNSFKRTTWLEQLVQQLLPGSKIVQGEFPQLEERGAPFLVRVELENGSLLQRTGDRTLMNPVFLPSQMRNRYVRKGERVHPLVSAQEYVMVEECEVRLGGSWRVLALPATLDLCGAWGSYHLGYRRDGDSVFMTRRLQMLPFQVEPRRFHEFIDVCSSIDQKEEERVALAPIASDPK